MVRVLDHREAQFRGEVRKLLDAQVEALAPMVDRALSAKSLAPLQGVPVLPGYRELVYAYGAHVLVDGILDGRQEVARANRRAPRRQARTALLDNLPVVPREAVAWLRSRVGFAEGFERAVRETIRGVLVRALEVGASTAEVVRALQAALPNGLGRTRAQLIARTESTAAFNQGRLVSFRQAGDWPRCSSWPSWTPARASSVWPGTAW